MLLEGYLAKKKTYPQTEVHIVVTRTARSILSPSKELLNDYKYNGLTWAEYEQRFIWEMIDNPKAMEELKRIKELAITKDVRLICYEKAYPCHRFILIKLVNAIVNPRG